MRLVVLTTASSLAQPGPPGKKIICLCILGGFTAKQLKPTLGMAFMSGQMRMWGADASAGAGVGRARVRMWARVRMLVRVRV